MTRTLGEQQAADLIYPLVQAQNRAARLMRRYQPGDRRGSLCVDITRSLYRAEKVARTLYSFDPTGL